MKFLVSWNFLSGSAGKEPVCQYRGSKRCGFDPWFGRSPGGGKDNLLRYSCQENPMDRGVWWAIVHRVTKNWTWLSIWAHMHILKLWGQHFYLGFAIIKEKGHEFFLHYISLYEWLMCLKDTLESKSIGKKIPEFH